MNLPVQTRAYAIYVFGPCPDGKFYVGQTYNFVRRFGSHSKALGECPEFHKALRRFGLNKFPVQIVAETDIAEEADRLERLFITKFNALIPHGYNLTIGGRAQRFEPGAKLVGFSEHPVTDAEIQQTAQAMADGKYSAIPQIQCPCCNGLNDETFPTCRCGVAPDFSRWLLRWMAKGSVLAELSLVEDPKLVKKWRASRDADFFLLCEKRRVKGRTIASVAPVAMHKYAARFWPYLESAVRQRCLIAKKLPCYHLGEFRPVTARAIELKRISVERQLRRNRSELGSGEGNIEVFAKIVGYEKCQSGNLFDATIATMREHGGSEVELAEACRRALLYRELESGLPDFHFLGGSRAYASFVREDLFAYVNFESRESIEMPLRTIMALQESNRVDALRQLIDSPPQGVSVERTTYTALREATGKKIEAAQKVMTLEGDPSGSPLPPVLFRGQDD